jgi:transposase
MAPNLSVSQHEMIRDMILSKSLKQVDMASAAGCSARTIYSIESNLKLFGDTKAPPNGVGRPRSITPQMRGALREHLTEKPELYLDEMAVFLYDEFKVHVTTSSIRRALVSMHWTKKAARRIAKQRNPDLRDFYHHYISDFHSNQLIFVDESGCDQRAGFRRTGWSPLGKTPVQIARFHRSRRYQILPAYTQDGILLSRIFQGSTDGPFYEDFIEQLLQHCGRWPEPKSVLVMDNASFHRSDRIEKMCSTAGVKLVYLPPYSPDLNPIEEFFSELKAFIKRHWAGYEEKPHQDFEMFLEWCVATVGARSGSAEAHFRHSGISVEK